jgi:hypothetical protein
MSDEVEVLRGQLVYELEPPSTLSWLDGLRFTTECTNVADELVEIALALDR